MNRRAFVGGLVSGVFASVPSVALPCFHLGRRRCRIGIHSGNPDCQIITGYTPTNGLARNINDTGYVDIEFDRNKWNNLPFYAHAMYFVQCMEAHYVDTYCIYYNSGDQKSEIHNNDNSMFQFVTGKVAIPPQISPNTIYSRKQWYKYRVYY